MPRCAPAHAHGSLRTDPPRTHAQPALLADRVGHLRAFAEVALAVGRTAPTRRRAGRAAPRRWAPSAPPARASPLLFSAYHAADASAGSSSPLW